MDLKALISSASKTVNEIKETIKAGQEFISSVKDAVKAMTPEQVTQLKQCKNTYDALKTVISGVIQDVKDPHDVNGWINIFDNFDKNWDDFAEDANSLFNSLSSEDQKNILETFAKNKFGEEIFNAASSIKNNSADVLKGITNFKGALGKFSGNYRDPLEATTKIRDGVSGIVSATEKVAGAAEQIVKGLAGLTGKTPDGIPVLSQLSKLSSYKAVSGVLTVLNTGVDGMNIYSGSKQLTQCIKNGDIPGAISTAEQMYGNIKKIVSLAQKDEAINSVATKIVDRVNSNRLAQGLKSNWNIGATGLYTATSVKDVIASIKAKDLKGAYNSGKVVVNNVKSIANEIKNIAKGNKAGDYVSPVKAMQGKSSPGTSSAKSSDSTQSADSSYTYVCSGAKLKCTFGDSLANLTVLPTRTINLYGQPMANITDHISMVNVSPFGKCRTTMYPPTATATAAAHGKLTPMPCVPGTNFEWMKGKDDVLLKGAPALLSSSILKCIYGGTITIVFDGQNV